MKINWHGTRNAIFAATIVFSTAVGAFQPPVDQAAIHSKLAVHSTLTAVTLAGTRIVAVGARGHIAISDDSGRSWRQAQVPVSTDLVAVSFPTPKRGWAVGHGGVVLHSSDGGGTWVKQLGGRAASVDALRYYQSVTERSPDIELAVRREKALAMDSGTQSFLDVFFETDQIGYIVGTFNRIFRTENGGKTWEPWMDRTENPKELNFYGVRARGGQWYLSGEQGMVWRLDHEKKRFVALQTPYSGTLFGLVLFSPEAILAYGMRGSLYRSVDQGATWAKIDAGTAAGIAGGTQFPDGRIALAYQDGGFSISADQGQKFVVHKMSAPMPNSGIVAIEGRRVALTGNNGIRVETIR